MLLAVLYSADEAVLAVAMACDQQVLGDHFWFDVQAIDVPPNFETAYVQIEDTSLAERLLDVESQFVDGHAAAVAIEQYNSQREPKIKKRQAAA